MKPSEIPGPADGVLAGALYEIHKAREALDRAVRCVEQAVKLAQLGPPPQSFERNRREALRRALRDCAARGERVRSALVTYRDEPVRGAFWGGVQIRDVAKAALDADAAADLCDDEGCEHHGTPHVCVHSAEDLKSKPQPWPERLKHGFAADLAAPYEATAIAATSKIEDAYAAAARELYGKTGTFVAKQPTVHELLALQEQGAILTDAEARRVDAWRAQQRAQAALDDDGA